MNKRNLSKLIAFALFATIGTSILTPSNKTQAMEINENDTLAKQVITVDSSEYEMIVDTNDPNKPIVKIIGANNDEYTEIVYDRERDILITNGVEHNLNTTVTILAPELGITEAEVLEADRNMYTSNNSRATIVDLFLPSNVTAVDIASLSKTLPNYYGKFESTLGTLSAAATAAVVFGAPFPGASALLSTMAAVTGLTSYALSQLYGDCGGTFSYVQQRTSKMYTIGVLYDYAYRYKNTSLNYYVTFNGKKYNAIKYDSGVGNWWTNQKPW